MLTILSPSKTLDESPSELETFSQPVALDQTEILVRKMKRYSARSIEKLLDISAPLAELNQARYAAFETPFDLNNAKQAIFAFKGDSYTGFELDSYGEEDFCFAQDHLRILSGLYGLLRPLDLMQPYRLEMGTSLKTPRGKKLTDFWGDRITSAVNDVLAEQDTKVLLNLASNQYFSAISPRKLEGRVVNVEFRELKGDKAPIISFFAKRARGAMANHVIRHRIDDVDGIKAFDVDGYVFDRTRSSDDTIVFVRNQEQ